MDNTSRLPLAGLRVLDFGNVFSVPYMGGLMADMGAEVIKIEAPQRLDQTRGIPQFIDNAPGDRPWNRSPMFQVLNRGKRSLVMDMTKPEGQEVFRKLVAVSDFVVDNFTPRVLPGWGMSYENLKKINPRIIMVSNCGYGSTGPWGPLPIQGTSLEATNGIIKYTGYPDAAQKAGQSYPDFLACWTALFAAFTALHAREQTGEGQWIDQSMYQIGVSLIPEPILQYELDGSDLDRIGNRDRFKAPSNLYKAKGEDKWLTLSVDSDAKWQSLLKLMNRSDLAGDERFMGVVARLQNVEALDEIVAAWAAEQEPHEATQRLQAAGIAAMPVLDAYEVHFNEQFLHRGFLEAVDLGGETGARPVFGRPYKMSGTDIKIRNKAPLYGEGNRYVLETILGLSADEVEKLYADVVVADDPVNPPPPPVVGALGNIQGKADADYREHIREVWGSSVESRE